MDTGGLHHRLDESPAGNPMKIPETFCRTLWITLALAQVEAIIKVYDQFRWKGDFTNRMNPTLERPYGHDASLQLKTLGR
jgi:hypothetical protein